MKRYINYHKHTHYSNIMTLDCIVKPEEYMERAIELGHKEYFTTEHGYQGNLFETYTLCQKYGLKCIFAVEAYYVDDRKESDKGNYHIILIAKNKKGMLRINKILSEANLTGYYHKPRIDKELLLTLNAEDVYITSACIASRLFKGENWFDEFFMPIYNHFGNSFYLEVQNHNTQAQKEHNEKILFYAKKYNLKIIHANDSHYIHQEDSKYRKQFLKAKNMIYPDEDEFILDYPDYETIVERYKKQGIFNPEQIEQAITNTLDFEMCDEVVIDKEFKIPKVVSDSNAELKRLVCKAWSKEKKNIPSSLHKTYMNEIKYEVDMIEKCGMADYFVLNEKVVRDAKEKYNGVLTRTGRGSGVSFYTNKLLGLTEIDRIWCPVKLYPSRFMSDIRILQSRSIPDLDQNWANVEPVVKATKDLLGDDGTRQMVSFKPMQNSSAFRLWCKSLDMDISEYDEVAKDLGEYKKEYDGKYKNDKKWMALIEDSKKFKGVIESVSPSPCSYLLYDKPITEHIGVIKIKGVICCLLDGYNCDYYKFLKQDYLIVTVWDIINKVYQKINQPIDNIHSLLSKCDDKMWKMIGDGITSTINQCDSDYDKQILSKYKPHSFEEMSAYAAAIRPGFASQLNNFIERKPYTTGVAELDELLKDSYHYLMYQESIMTYLVWLGIPEKDTYDIIKKISKKKFKPEELEELKNTLKNNWNNKIGNLDNFDKTWKAVEDAAKYSFNASHSVSVGLDAMYGAYLKSHYPLEYYTVALNVYKDEITKTASLINELPYFNIELSPAKFRHSSNEYTYDKENNIIYKSVSSLKYMNEECASKLYELKDAELNSFVDFLIINPCDSRQTEALIKLDFFSEFGKSAYLLKVYELFNAYYGKKQIKKDNCNIDESILQKYCTKETNKMYRFDDGVGADMLTEMTVAIPNKSISVSELIAAQKEYLGYIEYVNPKLPKSWWYVTELKTYKNKFKPYVTLYNLHTGEILKTKVVNSNEYTSTPFTEGSILNVWFGEKAKCKLINSKWQKTNEKETVMNHWEMVK